MVVHDVLTICGTVCVICLHGFVWSRLVARRRVDLRVIPRLARGFNERLDVARCMLDKKKILLLQCIGPSK